MKIVIWFALISGVAYLNHDYNIVRFCLGFLLAYSILKAVENLFKLIRIFIDHLREKECTTKEQ